MKKGFLLTTSLALALGLGAAVGAQQAEVIAVKAETTSVHIAGSFTDWDTNKVAMTFDRGFYSYTREFELNDEFKVVVNGSIWVGADWEGVSNSTGGKVADGGGGDHNFKVTEAGKFTIKAAAGIGDYDKKGYGVRIEPYSDDVPAEDGYYIVGTQSGWKYAGATKMDAGTDGNKAQLEGYNAVGNEIFKVRSYLLGIDTWYGENYEVGASAKTFNIYLNGSDEVYVQDVTPADEPSEEGYYIVGEFSSNPCWTYADAQKMTNTSFRGNVAYQMSFILGVGDEFRVKSWYNDREPKEQVASVGQDETFGHANGKGNFEVTTAGTYDVYAKYEDKDTDGNDEFYFYVAEHATTYQITMTGVLFEGKVKTGTQALEKQLAYAETDFKPEKQFLDGYGFVGFFEDEACETAYVAKEFTAAGQLYAKYMRVGAYAVGDEEFSGSAAGAWKAEGGTYLPAAVNDTENNLYEGAITVPGTASNEHLIEIRAAYVASNAGVAELRWPEYTLHENSYATKNGSTNNMDFKEGGTIAVYVNKSMEVYLSKGKAAFYTKFLTETGNICKNDGKTTDKDRLQEVWSQLKGDFVALGEDQAEIKAIGFNGGSDVDDAHKVVKRYNYIITKYGTSKFEDFIWEQTIDAAIQLPEQSLETSEVNNSMLVIIIASAASITAVGCVLLALKKKRQK